MTARRAAVGRPTKGVRAWHDDDAIRRWTIEDYENARFEDDHIEPYVHLRRISADPADPRR